MILSTGDNPQTEIKKKKIENFFQKKVIFLNYQNFDFYNNKCICLWSYIKWTNIILLYVAQKTYKIHPKCAKQADTFPGSVQGGKPISGCWMKSLDEGNDLNQR